MEVVKIHEFTMDGTVQRETNEQGNAPSKSVPPPRKPPSRACTECRRKKSKCDMKRPECSLCYRIGETCIYPARRAPGRKRALSIHNTNQQPSESCGNASTGGVSENHSSTTSASLENSLDSHICDRSPQFSEFALSNQEMTSPFAFMDLLENTELNSDFLADNFQPLSESYESSCLSIWPGDEVVLTTSTTNLDHGGSMILDGPITFPTTKVDEVFTKEQWLSQDSTYTIDIQPTLAFDLIEEFFIHVHCCLPLLNGVKVKKRYEYFRTAGIDKLDNLSFESALLLNGIFALAARFSKASIFMSEPPLGRGERFSREATRLFDISCKLLDKTCSSLEYVQGTILLTFNALQSGPTRYAWLLCGICARLSCELGLQDTDADLILGVINHTQLAQDVWQDREERRRAWWVIWDLDTFANGITLTPFALNLQHAKVLLPMSDSAWHGSENTLTTYLDPNGPTPWTKLSDSSCQSAWAWFLAGTTLVRQAGDMALSQNLTAQDMDFFETRAICFAMALPEIFQLESNSIDFDEENFREVNWIVSTLLMLQASLSLAKIRMKTLNCSPEIRAFPISTNDTSTKLQMVMSDLQSTRGYSRIRKEVARIVRAWSPQHLIFSGPLVAFCLVGPSFSNLSTLGKPESRNDLDTEITKLALKRLARYWPVAGILNEQLRTSESRDASESSIPIFEKKLWPPILSVNL